MNKRTPIILGIFLVGLAIWITLTPSRPLHQLIDRLNNLGYDLQLRARANRSNYVPKSPIAIVDIDDRSLKEIGLWPWPRNKVAELVTAVKKQGAAVIAFDMFFSEKDINVAEVLLKRLTEKQLLTPAVEERIKSNIPLFEEDIEFAKAIAQSPTILAFSFLPRAQTQNELPAPLFTLSPEEQKQLSIIQAKGFISNLPILQQAAKESGFINIYPDNDGIIRRLPLLMSYQGKVFPALPLQAVLSFLGEKAELETVYYNKEKKIEGIKLGTRIIPTDAYAQMLIPFVGKSYTFPYFSAIDVLNNKISTDALLGKIVFIGSSATSSGDLKATAIQNPFPGIEIQATVANGILENHYFDVPAWALGANLFIIVFFGLLAAFIFPYLGPRMLGLILFVFIPSLFILNNLLWRQTGLILSVLTPVALVFVIAMFNFLYGYLFETRRREHLKDMFGQYVPAKHIDEMLKTKSSYALGGEDREMSVLFADINNFTSISEGMPAAELVDLLNTFFTPMTEVIFKHRGTIDKYVGDLIMAFWGAPLRDKYHARHAMESALEMQVKLKALAPLLAEHHWPAIKIGIGINSGAMSVGDMGSRFRRNYTVLGDAVNIASRIESLTRYYGVDIIVTETTAKEQAKFVFRKLDRVKVKGKKNGIVIYELIGTEAHTSADVHQELSIYHQALEYYFAQRWEEALVLITQLYHTYPDKRIYQLYIERIKEFKTNPPAADWDGMYVHLSK